MTIRGRHYHGSTPYCYSNALAMVCGEAGATFAPGYIEATIGIGNGVTIVPMTDPTHPTFFFDNGAPDRGVSFFLETHNIEFEHRFQRDVCERNEAVAGLKELLASGPVVVGPVDMGYLPYLPDAGSLVGADHFVVVLEVTGDLVLIHDPEGFPFARLALEDFLRAWQADRIQYKSGSHQMWGRLRPGNSPSPETVFSAVARRMVERYTVNKDRDESFAQLAHLIAAHGLDEEQMRSLKYFSLRLAANRALDTAVFLENHDARLGEIKFRMARVFGVAQWYLDRGDIDSLPDPMVQLDALDKKFEIRLEEQVSRLER